MGFSYLFILQLRSWLRWSRTSWFGLQTWSLWLLDLRLPDLRPPTSTSVSFWLLASISTSLDLSTGANTPKCVSPTRQYNFQSISLWIAGADIWEPGPLTVLLSTLSGSISGFTIVRGYHLWTLLLPVYDISSEAQGYYFWMHADIIEQGDHLWTFTSKARLPLLNLYHHLAMENALVRALCSKTCRIAGEALVRWHWV